MINREIRKGDINQIVSLISEAMNKDEGNWAKTTLHRHFQMKDLGVPDGRNYIIFEYDDNIVGISGLHQYEWGPPQNTWLGWFALDPKYHGKGLGAKMMKTTENEARARGYLKLFVETYQNSTFEKAIKFYSRQGFSKSGSVLNYLPDNSDMIVFSKML